MILVETIGHATNRLQTPGKKISRNDFKLDLLGRNSVAEFISFIANGV